MVAQTPIITKPVQQSAPLTKQGGEDGIAIVFGLVGAMVTAVTCTAGVLMMARDPGMALAVMATVCTTYALGLGTLMWIGAAKRGTI